MRTAVLLALLVGCGSSKPSENLDDHQLHGGVETTGDAERIHYAGRGVALKDITAARAAVGLPVSGTADIAIDITTPIAHGKPDYDRATGSIDLQCTRCTLGDGVTKLVPRSAARANAFAGDGVLFGPVTFTRIEARLEIANGRAELVHWVAESPDVTLEAALTVDLASPLPRSTLQGCVRFAGTPALKERDPKSAMILSLTGAPHGDDGLDAIEIVGRIDAPRLLPHLCGTP